MSASYGFGLCGICDPDLTNEEKEDYLLCFAKKGFTDYFFEKVSGCWKKVKCDFDSPYIEPVVAIESPNEDSRWELTGGMSYDDWEALGMDILVPNFIATDSEKKSFESEYLDLEMRVGNAERVLKHLEESRNEIGIPEHFLTMLNKAIEKRYLLTISG